MTTYGVKITENSLEALWFKTDVGDNIPLVLESKESFGEGENCKKYSAFTGMDDNKCLSIFSKNRGKKVLVAKFPVPYGKRYYLDELWVIGRIKLLKR